MSDEYTEREMRLICERDAALTRAEEAEARALTANVKKDVNGVHVVNGLLAEVEVWWECSNGDVDAGAWVSYYKPLDIVTQGNTPEDAFEGMKVMLVWTVTRLNEVMVMRRGPNRDWRPSDE